VDLRSARPVRNPELPEQRLASHKISGFGTGSGGIDLWLAYKIYNSAPANVVIDMDDEGDDQMIHGAYMACS
jgi:hypothetical protein